MPSPTVYPLDVTGLASTNLITNEQHTLTELNATTYNLIVPTFAPFFVNNFSLSTISGSGVVTTLQPDVDYSFSLPFVGATRSIGTVIYGGVSLITPLVSGMIQITYQALGGIWSADHNWVLNYLATTAYNPRVTLWDLVTNVQQVFPPINHDDSFDYVLGQADLIAAINSINTTLLANPAATTGLLQHMANVNNPHGITAAQVGLDQIENLPIATSADISTLASVNKYITVAQVMSLVIAMKAAGQI